MSRKKSYLTSTDQFCGCGGSSLATMKAAANLKLNRGTDIKVLLAMNHWQLAIDSHNSNFPETHHVCANISTSDPRKFPSTDIGTFSPECTQQTPANGKVKPKPQIELFDAKETDPDEDRSRATMWDVPRFAEVHKYNLIYCENVPQARHWIIYDAWIHAMELLGYCHEVVYLNSKFCYPIPQSRDRMYVVFWKKGNKKPNLRFTPLAYCYKCQKNVEAVQSWKHPNVRWGVYGKRGQYLYCCPGCSSVIEPYYYAAINAIDWSDLGERIGDRTKPLVANTKTRVRIGLDKHAGSPFYIQLENTSNLSANINQITGPLPTQNTRQTIGVVNPPFIVDGSFNPGASRIKELFESFSTFSTQQRQNIVFPFIVENKGESTARAIFDPLSSFTTRTYHGIVSDHAFKSFMTYYYKTPQSSHITEAMGALSTRTRIGIVNYQKPDVEDCYYRTIRANEVQRGMGFDEDYIVLGDEKRKVIQLGNAVTPNALSWIIERGIETLL